MDKAIKLYSIIALHLLVTKAQPQQCPYGWKQRGTSCYAFFTDIQLSWTEAMLYCNALHAKLVEIETEVEDEFLRIYEMDHGLKTSFWIGLTDTLVEGHWVWETSQTTPAYTDWYPGEPNDMGHREDCGGMYYSGHWNDFPCNTTHSFICEKELDNEVSVIG
ncbi:perlucin-like [Saccostrea cucullata]|uniref:perlucin-like n=1 Tax=Saccostrea cuccullata TaxID=36930 RepID=UPI002ED4F879